MIGVFSFIKNKAIIILFIIVVILSLIIGVQYTFSLKDENTITSLTSKVQSLERDNLYLSSALESINSARQIENNVLQELREELESLKDRQEKDIEVIRNVYKEENIINHPLPPDLIRLLNDACKSVRGKACPDP